MNKKADSNPDLDPGFNPPPPIDAAQGGTGPKFRKISGQKIHKWGDGEALDVRVNAIREGRGRFKTKLAECVELGNGQAEPFLIPVSASLEGLLQAGGVYRIVHLGEQRNPNTGRTFRAFEVYEADSER